MAENTELNALLRNIFSSIVSLNKFWHEWQDYQNEKNARIKLVNERQLSVLLNDFDELKKYVDENLGQEVVDGITEIYGDKNSALYEDLEIALTSWNEKHIHKLPNGVKELLNFPVVGSFKSIVNKYSKEEFEEVLKNFICHYNDGGSWTSKVISEDDFQMVVLGPWYLKKPFFQIKNFTEALFIKAPLHHRFRTCLRIKSWIEDHRIYEPIGEFLSGGKKYKVLVKRGLRGFVMSRGLKKRKIEFGYWPSKMESLKNDFKKWSEAAPNWQFAQKNWKRLVSTYNRMCFQRWDNVSLEKFEEAFL